jgi:uncharacterized protein
MLYNCHMRYLSHSISSDLKKKMVVLSGPRQCGKSTLAKGLLDTHGVYLNWDIRKDQKIIREAMWSKDAPLVVLDELHKFPKWKNFLKGIVDEYQNRPPLLVTGSARLDTFRKQGDALTGRFFHYRLHPIDVSEAKIFLPRASSRSRLEHLLRTGGFPEAFLNPDEADRLRNDRFDLVIREDLRDLSKTNALRGIQMLIELLRERVGQKVSYKNLAEELSVSGPTVKSWLELLEKLCIVFVVRPYAKGLARSLKKEPKIYFYDCAAGYEPSGRLENAVACALLKHCDFQHDRFGKNMALCYFSDREKREVDFVVTLNRSPHWALEVKTSENELSPHLRYFHERAEPRASYQLVQNLSPSPSQKLEKHGIEIVNLAEWLDLNCSAADPR